MTCKQETHHTVRSYKQEEEYYRRKVSLYQELYWVCTDIAEEVNRLDVHSLAEKERIAKKIAEKESANVQVDEWGFGEPEGTMQRVHISMECDGWLGHMGIVWKVDQNPSKASAFFSECADCDIQINWCTEDGKPKVYLEYVELPHFPEKEYKTGHCIWDLYNINPFKEHFCIDGMFDGSFDDYAEHFNL